MCGIAAIVGSGAARPDPAHDAAARLKALDRLAPRGPDAVGEWSCGLTGDAWLGHRRLAVVDLSPAGAQPMVTPDGSTAVTYNGEIYNAPTLREELRRLGHAFRSTSDTEVLLHGYAAWGIGGLLARLQGMYAFALWDARARSLHAAVDHAGMKPLFHAMHAERLFIASTADALFDLGVPGGGVNREALAHVLCHGYIPAPLTAWRAVGKLAPGTAMSWRPGGSPPTLWRHWEPPGETAGTSDHDFPALWESVVHEHLESDVPVGVLLSSGVDSTCVAVAAARRGSRLACVTLSLAGADDESPVAARTARRLGLEHTSAPLDASDVEGLIDAAAGAYDEPQSYGALLTMCAVARAARRHAKVFLAGDGGDEAFAGYTWHTPPLSPADRPTPLDELRRTSERVASPRATGAERAGALDTLARASPLHAYAQRVHPLFHPGEAASLLGCDYSNDDYLAHLREAARPSLPWPRRAQAIDLACFCAGSILPKVDRGAMAHGLEVRCPFLDRRVLEWAISRPVSPQERDGAPKSLLRGYLAPHAPPEVLAQPKRGFSLRTDWSSVEPRLRDRIASSRAARDGLIRDDWRLFAASDAPYPQRRVFALAMLAAWWERRAP